MKYQIKTADNYYRCFCGGSLAVMIGAPVYGVSPCIYRFQCDSCGHQKQMVNRAEARSMAPAPFPDRAAGNGDPRDAPISAARSRD